MENPAELVKNGSEFASKRSYVTSPAKILQGRHEDEGLASNAVLASCGIEAATYAVCAAYERWALLRCPILQRCDFPLRQLW